MKFGRGTIFTSQTALTAAGTVVGNQAGLTAPNSQYRPLAILRGAPFRSTQRTWHVAYAKLAVAEIDEHSVGEHRHDAPPVNKQ